MASNSQQSPYKRNYWIQIIFVVSKSLRTQKAEISRVKIKIKISKIVEREPIKEGEIRVIEKEERRVIKKEK